MIPILIQIVKLAILSPLYRVHLVLLVNQALQDSLVFLEGREQKAKMDHKVLKVCKVGLYWFSFQIL